MKYSEIELRRITPKTSPKVFERAERDVLVPYDDYARLVRDAALLDVIRRAHRDGVELTVISAIFGDDE